MRKSNWLTWIIIGLLVFSTLPLTALAEDRPDEEQSEAKGVPGKYSSKDEVIYVNLDARGKTKNMYVVNTFHMTNFGEVVDHGNYRNVINLTDLSVVEKSGKDEVHFQAEADEFYYQGELQNEPLPWEISIDYYLDGEKVNPNELAGKSGKVKLQITTSAKEAVDPVFFEHFLLQLSLTLDPTIFHDIQAPKGTVANEGKNKQVSFSVMPEQEEVLIVSALVTDFEMEPIEIIAIPANIAIEDPDISGMTDDMDALSTAIKEVNSGVTDLSAGLSDLTGGATELSSGSSTYRTGMTELDQSSGELVSGSKEINKALQQVEAGLQDSPEIDKEKLAELKQLPAGFRDLSNELRDFAKSLDQLKGSMNDIPDRLGEQEMEALYGALTESDLDPTVVEQLIETYETAQVFIEMNQGIPQELIAGMTMLADQLETLADDVESELGNLDQLDDLALLQEGLTTLSSEYRAFHNGLVRYTSGVNELATAYEELDTGIEGVSSGAMALDDGVKELAEGTKELQAETADLPSEMEAKIDEFMEDYDFADFEPTSFVSDQNEAVGVVQFILQTERIEIVEQETEQVEEAETKSFWDRFIDLFTTK